MKQTKKPFTIILNLFGMIPKDWKARLAARNDEGFQKLRDAWYQEQDPELKEQKLQALWDYWDKRRKELGVKSLKEIEEEEKKEKKRQEEESKQREIARQKHLLWVNEQIDKGIPAKFVLYCDYPGLEFKTELDADIGISYEINYDDYWHDLYLYIDQALCEAHHEGIEKLLDAHYTEDDVSPGLYFDYSEVTMRIQEEIPHNENVKIYLDSLDKDGKLIETKEIDIMGFFKRHPDHFQEGGMWNATNEYISASQSSYIRNGEWHFALTDDEYCCVIENPEEWPAPKSDGSWVDEDEGELHPCVWYKINRIEIDDFEDPWVLNDQNLDFWLYGSGDWFLEYSYDGHAGCYSGEIPCIKELREKCPVKIEDEETGGSLENKIQAFFVEKYKEGHKH